VHPIAVCLIFLFTGALIGDAAADCPLTSCLAQKPGTPAETMFKDHATPGDLLARLVYAEALSTGYAHEPLVYQAIAWGVMNRVRLGDRSKKMGKAYGQGIHGVIFKKGQFNPAVSVKSPFHRHFLCPDYAIRWHLAVNAAEAAIKGQDNPFLQTPWEKKQGLSLVVNFYYPRSIQAKGPLPPWEGHRGLIFIGDVTVGKNVLSSECIRFYRQAKPPGDIPD